MIDIAIIFIVALVALVFSGRITTPDLLSRILYNDEFKEVEVKSSEEIQEVNPVETPVESETHEVEEIEEKPKTQPKESATDKKKKKAPKVIKKEPVNEEHLDTVELVEGYSMDEVTIDSKSLIKEILSRE